MTEETVGEEIMDIGRVCTVDKPQRGNVETLKSTETVAVIEAGGRCDGRPQRSARRSLRAPPPCGARTRAGHPCRMKREPGRARCRLHGGLSTGPKTPEGKARIAEAQRKRRATQPTSE